LPKIGFSQHRFRRFYEEIGYDFSVPFIQSKDGNPNAAVRFKSKLLPENDDEFSVGFFLGTAFDTAK
jgi:hypothetical protein